VEHVLATSTLPQKKSQNMLVQMDGVLAPMVTSKDVVLHVCGVSDHSNRRFSAGRNRRWGGGGADSGRGWLQVIGTAGGTGCTIEFAGEAIRALSMEARMSICNMAIEAGARAGLIAPDRTTYDYLRGRPMVPSEGTAEWDAAVAHWDSLSSDEGAHFDKVVVIDATDIAPTVTWGTSPQDVAPITGVVGRLSALPPSSLLSW
jgi:3-isopropylmalate dehydratase